MESPNEASAPLSEPRHDPTSDTFYNLIKNDPFGVYIVDADFRLAEVSLGAQKVFSSVRPLLGRDFGEVLRVVWPEPFATEAIERFRHTLETGETYVQPHTLERRRDTSDVEAYDWRISRITLPDGRYGVVCYFYDLSERQQWERALLESEARFREMVDGLPLIVWVHDADGDQEMVNETFCEFFGVTRAEMKGGRWKMLMHSDDAEAYAAEFSSCVRDRRAFNARVRVKRADGQWRWIESWGRPRFAADGQFRGFVGTSADITDRIAAEEALREADRRKDEFLAVLGHELRNPLAPLRTSVELMERAHSHPEVADSAMAIIKRQLAHLMRLTDDLLDVARISRGIIELHRAPIDLNAVVDVALEQTAPLLEHLDHELIIERAQCALPIYGDLERLTQAVGNVLTNAARYTEPGGKITVRTESDGSHGVVRVLDTGLGIPPDQLDAIFGMFSQVAEHRARLGGGGLGIGLALVRQLLAMHGGSIEARSEGLGQGAEFIIRLALSPHHRQSKQEAAERAEPGHRRRILIVDDNVDAAESMRLSLSLRGHDVRAVHGGADALQETERFDPEVVLLDIGLPRVDGYSVARALRSTPRGKEVLLVALTGWGQPDDKRRAADAGFDEHLTKPVDGASLAAVVGRDRHTEGRPTSDRPA